jgi:hypothetical protein
VWGEAVGCNLRQQLPKAMEANGAVVIKGDWVGFFGDQGVDGRNV